MMLYISQVLILFHKAALGSRRIYLGSIRNLELIISQNKIALAKFKSSFSITDYKEFSFLRAKYKYESKKSCRKYTECVEKSLFGNFYDFWKVVNNKRSNNNIPLIMSLNGVTSSNKQETANIFSDFFSSVYTTELGEFNIEKLDISTFDIPNIVMFSVEGVFLNLSALHSVGSVGPDGLSSTILYELKYFWHILFGFFI